VKKNGQKVRSFRKQIADAAAHEDVKVRADEIMAYQHGYQQGADTLVVYDFETGEARDVPIDPLKGGPVAAAEALYKKARKQRRTATAVEPLLEAASREAEYLEQVEFSIRELTGTDGEDDVAALEQINAELVDARLVKPTGKGAAAEIKRQERGSGKGGKKKAAPQKAKKKGRDDPMLNIRKYAAPSGKEVLVGRNSRGNEAVSLSIGKDQDVWFHVRGAPGAHVILRQQPGQEASDEDLQYAADLAAFHSKLRTGGKVDVSFTSPKFVRKPSGGRLGMVTIDKEKVMLGMPDASEAAEEEAKDRAAGKKTASSW
jgi:predicted ribosome quality control (RQC) complex YloA/Tae2 family protein